MRPSLIAALIVLLAPAATLADQPDRLDDGERGRVRIDGALWEALQPVDPIDPELPGPTAITREVVLEPSDDALLVHATWQLDAFEPGWFDAVLANPELRDVRVTWDGGPAAWDQGAAGVQVTGFVRGPTTVELRGELPGDPLARTSHLKLLPAIRGDLEARVPEGVAASLEGDASIRIDDHTFWTAAPHLGLTLREAAPARDRGTLAVGAVGVGLTVGDTELQGRARVRWTLRRGSLERLALRASNVGDDLQVSGATVRSVSRSGDRLLIELQAPTTTSTTIDLSWSATLPTGGEGSLAVPTLVPEGVSRTSSSLQLARDGEWEALPELDGWAPRAGSLLPEWGKGLVEGTPTAAFVTGVAGRAGTISLLRFEPVSGPPVMVDVADFELAATAEGRLLTRVRYEVVNDRGAWLEILPPFGATFLSVRVDEEPAAPTRAGGAWRIPLPRSLETVAGLISVPVEVVLLTEDEPWERRETRHLALPVVDAPVAASRVTLYLPPGYREAPRNDDVRRVDSFTEGEGISWGFLAEDEDSRDKAARADLVFKQAQEAWLDNEFDTAQQHLDDLAAMGAGNAKTHQLQSNLDVVFEPVVEEAAHYGYGGGSGSMSGGDGLLSVEVAPDADNKRGGKADRSSGEEALRRRIREQAKARGEEEYREYESTRREAERALEQGDYEAAEARFRRAREVGRKLEFYEQEESEEVSQLNAEIDRQLADVTVKREEKERRLAKVVAAPKPKAKKKAPARKQPLADTGLGGLGGRGRGAGGGGVSRGAAGAGVAVSGKSTSSVTWDFDDALVEGELLTPSEVVVDGRYTAQTEIDFSEVDTSVVLGPHPSLESTGDEGKDEGLRVILDADALDFEDGEFGWETPEPAPEVVFGHVHEPEVDYVIEIPPTDPPVTTARTFESTVLLPGSHQVLTVTAATRSVPIPRIGQPLRFQQLLLPAGEAPDLVVRARLPRSEGTPR